jgi:abelson tyrosine-protein kinase 1
MNVIRASWDRVPSNRPSFEKIARDLKKQRSEWSLQSPNSLALDTPKTIPLVAEWDSQSPYRFLHHSPDIMPRPLPGDAELDVTQDLPVSGLGLDTGEDEASSLSSVEELSEVVPLSKSKPAAKPVVSMTESTNTLTSNTSYEPDLSILASGYLSPPDPNDISAKYRDERRYRMLLQHEYHTIRGYPISILDVNF